MNFGSSLHSWLSSSNPPLERSNPMRYESSIWSFMKYFLNVSTHDWVAATCLCSCSYYSVFHMSCFVPYVNVFFRILRVFSRRSLIGSESKFVNSLYLCCSFILCRDIWFHIILMKISLCSRKQTFWREGCHKLDVVLIHASALLHRMNNMNCGNTN